MMKDKDPDSDFVFSYQRKIYTAACVKFIDGEPEAAVSQKVRRLFEAFPQEFLCSGSDFDVSKGSILKYAVSKKFDSFLQDATLVWKLDLNGIDKSDNKTMLDYIAVELCANEGTPNEAVVRRYHRLARNAGALYRSELANPARNPNRTFEWKDCDPFGPWKQPPGTRSGAR